MAPGIKLYCRTEDTPVHRHTGGGSVGKEIREGNDGWIEREIRYHVTNLHCGRLKPV
jgi:hypothetical protein